MTCNSQPEPEKPAREGGGVAMIDRFSAIANRAALCFAMGLIDLTSSPAFAAEDTPPAPGGDQAIVVTGEREAESGYRTGNSTTATRTNTPLINVPQSITVVTLRNIQDRAANSIADAVAYVPGVQSSQGENNRDTLVLRGNTVTGDFFVDGVRDDVQTFRDLYNIERLEVFRGPNAMIFGRGGIGGVINRVTKVADWTPRLAGRIEAGSYAFYRGSIDIDQPLSGSVALRLTGVWQNAGGFRDDTYYDRWGLNPTLSFRTSDSTLLTAGYEHFKDDRTAERGVPSQPRINGIGPNDVVEPLATPRSTLFGDPAHSFTFTNTDALTFAASHNFSDHISLRTRFRYADYHKFYQNIFPGAVSTTALTDPAGLPARTYAAGTIVQINAYNNQQLRTNLFNQTDFNAAFNTGRIKHRLLLGFELGRQRTDNVRNEGFFPTPSNPAGVQAIFAPVAQPDIRRGDVIWRQIATSGNNIGVARIAGLYTQDQIEFAPWLQAIVGIRYDYFNIDFRDRRSAAFRTVGGITSPEDYDITDNLWSPRAGLILKPVPTASLYAVFSRTYQPRAGDQLASITLANSVFAPERFDNYEVGVKWDVLPTLNVSAALYRLDRTNVIVPDPNNPGQNILAGAQRQRGFELGLVGNITPAWSVQGGYAYQDGKFTQRISATVPAGNRPANLPKHSASLWTRYDIGCLGIGAGVIHQSSRFAATDNLVRLPAYTRVDAALFYDFNTHLRAQVNVENVLDAHYFINADSNNNISPGSPTAFRAAISASF
jgi:catecholate siderophore receptor